MTPLVWLDDHTPLPHPERALPEGLLAVGGSLSVQRLTEAYSKGIFPWYSAGEPVLWWSPDPRMVLHCEEFSPSASLAKKLRQIARQELQADARIQVRADTAFAQVMQACAQPRNGQPGTWISDEIQQAYCAWHAAGQAHSMETWIDGRLAGGLYGVGLGQFFFGESMFARVSDASKIALAYLVAFLRRHGVRYIDCQQQTPHLARMGARPIPRDEFLARLGQALAQPEPPWQPGQMLAGGQSVSATP